MVVCKDASGRGLLETTFVDGLKDGNETLYSSKTGKIFLSQNLSHGKKQGVAKEFNADNGQLVFEADYVEDKVSGKLKAWDANGTLIADLDVKADQAMAGFDQRPGRERHYENGTLHGEQKDYTLNKKREHLLPFRTKTI